MSADNPFPGDKVKQAEPPENFDKNKSANVKRQQQMPKRTLTPLHATPETKKRH